MMDIVALADDALDQLLGNQTGNLWKPLPGPQFGAVNNPADELFYGGAAGGGKSDLMLGLALTAHRKSIFFRREYGQLRDVIERSRELLQDTDARLNENAHIWRDIPGGRMLEFGAIGPRGAASMKGLTAYKGRPHDLIAIDEVSDFTEQEYLFLTGWNRTTVKGQRVRIVAGGNPPTTPEGEWVVTRWAPWLDPDHPNPARPGELRWFARVDDKEVECASGEPFEHEGQTIRPRSRTFIPARVDDNPFLADDGNYVSVLQSLPDPLRSQLLYGDFSIQAEDDIWQVIPTAWVQAAQRRWREGERPDFALRAAGGDIARGGKDKTALARLYGNWFEIDSTPGTATPDGPAAAKFIADRVEATDTLLAIDVIGIGAAAYDAARALGYTKTIPVNFGAGSSAKDKSGKYGFTNLRAEAYWRFREALDPDSGEDIALPDEREVLADLCSARYKVVGAKYQIEDKEHIKQRIGRSPDKGDSFVMTWWAVTHRPTPRLIALDW